MDAKFHAAIDAVAAGAVDRLRALVAADPTLATGRSSTSHPTLLQCVVLGGEDAPRQLELAQILVDAGAELNAPLVASAGIDNVAAAALLLDRGAAIDGTVGWSPIEEALYWHSCRAIDLLMRRGAAIRNLRTAAGLGRVAAMASFFADDGSLRAAGGVAWPWGDLDTIAHSNHEASGKGQLAAKFSSFAQDRQAVVDHALVYACMHGHVDAAVFLLARGARLNVIPDGFDFSGTALHYAALNGYDAMVEFLIGCGADPRMTDTKVGRTPADWADHGRHAELSARLRTVSG